MRHTIVAALLVLSVPAEARQGTGEQDPDKGAEEEKRIEVMARPRALALRRGEEPIRIDGSLLDWGELPPLVLNDGRQLSGTRDGAWRGPADLSAKAFLCWDEEDLYFAAVVRDDWHRTLTEDDRRSLMEIPGADAIVLTFDPERNTRTPGPDTGRTDDRGFWLGAIEGEEHRLLLWDRYRGTGRFVGAGAVRVVHHRDAGRTTYEARIPMAEILPVGTEAGDGVVIDLQVEINDYDEITDPMPQTRIGWTFGTGPAITPQTMGAVMLVDEIEAGTPHLPAFPDRPAHESPVGGKEHWLEELEKLRRTAPVVYDTAMGAPSDALGVERYEVLKRLEAHAERYPRIDYLELNMRIHRAMPREVAGYVRHGLPALWMFGLLETIPRMQENAPPEGFRLFRLPQGGWLVRSEQADFAIDPAGPGLDRRLGPGLDFVLLTQPLNPTKRHDQLLVDLRTGDPPRTVLHHASFHLPGLPAEQTPIAELGRTYRLGPLEVTPLGRADEDGSVPMTVSYEVRWPDGTRLVVGAPQLREEHLDLEEPVDALLLSVQHPYAQAVVHRLRPRLTVLDDVLMPADIPGRDGRVALKDVFTLQKSFGEHPSAILAAGESWDIAPH